MRKEKVFFPPRSTYGAHIPAMTGELVKKKKKKKISWPRIKKEKKSWNGQSCCFYFCAKTTLFCLLASPALSTLNSAFSIITVYLEWKIVLIPRFPSTYIHTIGYPRHIFDHHFTITIKHTYVYPKIIICAFKRGHKLILKAFFRRQNIVIRKKK